MQVNFLNDQKTMHHDHQIHRQEIRGSFCEGTEECYSLGKEKKEKKPPQILLFIAIIHKVTQKGYFGPE